MTVWAVRASVSGLVMLLTTSAQAQDAGGYGRFQGDVSVSIEAGVSEAFAGESLAARAGVFYLSSVGIVTQYNDSFDNAAQPLRRSILGAVEVRPLFMARFARNMEHGPAYLDLLLDSVSLALGTYRAWENPRFCKHGDCVDIGMAASLGMEMSLLPQANTPFVGLRGGLRWSLRESSAAFERAPLGGMLTLSLGYHHLFATHLVDAADRLPQ